MPAALWLIVLPLLSAPIVYFMGHKGRKSPTSPENGMYAGGLAFIVLATMFFPFFLTVDDFFLRSEPVVASVGMISFAFDGIALLMTGVVTVLALMVVVFSISYLKGTPNEAKFYALLLIMVASVIGLTSTHDLFNLWVWFETMAISTYTLVAYYHEEPTSLEAGIKYLVQSATGSVLVLLGVALVLGVTGTLDLVRIQETAVSGPLFVASALLLIGFGIKASLVPLHTWLPDAHSRAPSGMSAMLSGVVIEVALVALMRTLGALLGSAGNWGVLLMGAGALNMLLGNLMALRQHEVKRMLAFSSLSHVGYILIGLGIGVRAGVVTGFQGSAFHVLNHAVMKGLAFLSAGVFLYTVQQAEHSHEPLMIDDLRGASRRYPLVALALSIALLGLGGLPPLAGFMSKWQIFAAGFVTGDPVIEAFVVFAALMSVLSLAYYVPVVNVLYRQEVSSRISQAVPVPGNMLMPLVILGLIVVVLGIWPGLMTWLTGPAGIALLTALGT